MAAPPPPRGFLLVDKPRGISSYAVVDLVRRALGPGRRRRGAGKFRCGHAGTLDPLATGLLLVLVGPETRLSRFLLGHDKRYAFTLRLGQTTETLDADGEVVGTGSCDVDAADISALLPRFLGEIEQVPPIYSALKRDGRPLYARARDGEALSDPEPRPVRIDGLDLLGEPRFVEGEAALDVDLDVACSSGTYVRSLARDIAAALGTVGHVASLRRTHLGPFELAEALPAARMQEADGRAEALHAALRPGADALRDLPALPVGPDEAEALRRGCQPDPDWLVRLDGCCAADGLLRLLDPEGDLVAVARRTETVDGTADPRLEAVFPPPETPTREDPGS